MDKVTVKLVDKVPGAVQSRKLEDIPGADIMVYAFAFMATQPSWRSLLGKRIRIRFPNQRKAMHLTPVMEGSTLRMLIDPPEGKHWVKNIMSQRWVLEDVDTPFTSSVSSETYWSS